MRLRRPGRRERRNRDTYSRPDVVQWYAAQSGLQPGERALLTAYRDELENALLLDIGMGGGRTTEALLPLAGRYVGVDYAAPLVEAAWQLFPQVDLRWADARELGSLGLREVDVAWFSFNGIDYVDHAGRMAVLRQVRAVLRPGGLFLFSSHNRDLAGAGRLPWLRPRPTRRWLRQTAHAARHLSQHLRMRGLQRQEEGYALLNDDAHDYTLLTYYVSREAQEQQLRDAGLEPVAVYRQDGEPLTPGRTDTTSVWLHYAARRPQETA